MTELKILYRASSKEEAESFWEKNVKPIDDEGISDVKKDPTPKGNSWVVLGLKKTQRKPTIVEPKH